MSHLNGGDMIVLAHLVTYINSVLGRVAAWLCLVIVLLQVAIVLNRYCFGYSEILGYDMINYEEALLYGFSAIFLLGAAYTYIHDGHVRVDILYANASPYRKAVTDVVGNIVLLMPLAFLILVKSNINLDLSWSIAEGSVDGGLPYVYLWMTLLPAFSLSIAMQGVANTLNLVLTHSSKPRLAEQVLALLVGLIAAWLIWVTFGWSLDANWSNPAPAWREPLYQMGVWFARSLSVLLLIWCTVVLFKHIPPRPSTLEAA